VTLDRRMKGTDQKGSLGPDGIYRMVRDIRLFEMSLGKEEIFIEPSVMASRIKLERSIATNKDLKAGQVITENDIHMLSPGDGFKWAEKDKVIGKKLSAALNQNEIIYPKHIGA
jgi:sialic acid synthase